MPDVEEKVPAAETPPEAASAPQTETPKPNGYVPGEEKKGFAEFRRILKERRALRKDLKLHGIKKRSDFEAIAESLGLVLWKGNAFFIWLHFLFDAIRRGIGLKALLGASAAVLAGGFVVSSVTDKAGSFTINLTAEMLRAGYVLSITEDFQREETRLFSEKLEQVNNITISDIDPEVDEINGPHNGQNYIAYTFYIRNTGETTSSYAWYVNMVSDTMDVSKAVWMMLFEDGHQVIYARETDDGDPEELYGFTRLDFADAAYDYDAQYYEKDGKYGLVTTPYADPDKDIVAQGLVENVEPGETHKYTVVLWVEGYDPECTDEIFGGYAKYAMDFENVSAEEDDNIFSGVYRTEYEEYGQAEKEAESEEDEAESGAEPDEDDEDEGEEE